MIHYQGNTQSFYGISKLYSLTAFFSLSFHIMSSSTLESETTPNAETSPNTPLSAYDKLVVLNVGSQLYIKLDGDNYPA